MVKRSDTSPPATHDPASNESRLTIRIKELLTEYDRESTKPRVRANLIRKESSAASDWSICKQLQQQSQQEVNKHANRISSNDESGYSCGLWQLFHFFSGSVYTLFIYTSYLYIYIYVERELQSRVLI